MSRTYEKNIPKEFAARIYKKLQKKKKNERKFF